MNKDSYTIHGGNWLDDAAFARAAYRDYLYPVNRSDSIGFRAVEEVMCMVRGGSWDYLAADARAACRLNVHPDDRGSVVGFRIMEGL